MSSVLLPINTLIRKPPVMSIRKPRKKAADGLNHCLSQGDLLIFFVTMMMDGIRMIRKRTKLMRPRNGFKPVTK